MLPCGHIHKPDYNSHIVSLGFDELGDHGMIVGDIQKGNLKLEFVPLDEEQFKEIEINVTDVLSKEELIEEINALEISNKEYIKIILTGNRNFEINKYELLKYIVNERIIKLKDHTRMAYDLAKMVNENTLKGLFAKQMLEKLNQPEIKKEEKEIIEKAIEIGLEALE